MAVVQGIAEEPKAVEQWFSKLGHDNEKWPKPILPPHHPPQDKVFTDNSLPLDPEPNSQIVDRAQGLFGSAALDEISLLMTMNFVFTQGEYNGSTLSLLGRNAVSHLYREMRIVGGTGVFRLAQGIASAKTASFSTITGLLVEYNVMVIHY
ncbi:unnamed protein product [Ilex paraguariensis]|uniref:Dirigent protein n=1 Tax=Ilex paraguariensis TaxID=185542 RepID=A0ABC8R9Z4_9AQUA